MSEQSFLEFIQPRIEKQIYDFFSSPRKKVFFGKGRQARIMLDVANMIGVTVECLISTKNEPTQEEHLRNIRSYSLEEFSKSELIKSDVLIAVNESLNEVIEFEIKKHGVTSVYKANNWKAMNKIFRESYFEFMLQKNGMDCNLDIITKNGFKIWNWKKEDNEYQENFLVEAVDLLYPFLFSDTKACVEGPYEYDRVVCKEGEIVIDAGANIGLFSCLAASKGCKVYAFEPTQKTRKYLQKNIELYEKGNVEILSYALSDKKGVANFAINDQNSGDSGKNCLSEQVIEGFHLEKVFTTSIDQLVEENVIQGVDFIKADIEGAERNLLAGARKTLERFAPKLAICTYHLPDDKEVLTDLILEANPSYKIIYEWKKLYAYVPKKGGEK